MSCHSRGLERPQHAAEVHLSFSSLTQTVEELLVPLQFYTVVAAAIFREYLVFQKRQQGCEWQLLLVIPAHRRLRQEDGRARYLVRLCLKEGEAGRDKLARDM